MKTKKVPLINRFWKYVDKSNGPLSCWNWTASTNDGGYGKTTNEKGITKRSHRVSFEMMYGKIPNGLLVLHFCDNPLCVNPLHLYLGSQQDNMNDMKLKKRGRAPKGEGHKLSKLKKEQILEIRNLLKDGLLHKDISVRYNIHKSTVSKIATNRRWQHL